MRRFPLLAAASVVGLTLAVLPAAAQDDDYGPAPQYAPEGDYAPPPDAQYDQAAPDEDVIVRVPRPRYTPREGALGAPVENVSLSQEVRYDDLDLTTQDGVDELRERIRDTARAECRQLDAMYPVAADDSPPCFRTAMEDAMQQADEAIDRARSYADRE